jgi:phosphoribosylaminoimidazole-succinocarboxamide synthase
MVDLVGAELSERVREAALRLYRRGAEMAERAGILLADTKFELGTALDTGELILIDEVLTPDSSRFWDAADYEPGRAQASFDKQFVRDWLEAQPWSKTYPGPELPAEIVAGTRERYLAAFERITGASFERYIQEDVIAP